MLLRVIHTADLHIGKNRKHTDYLEQQRYMLEAILGQVKGLVAEAGRSAGQMWARFILAGDIFDRNEDTTLDEYLLFLTKAFLPLLDLQRAHPHCFDFYVIDGNHDRTTNEASPSMLHSLLPLCPTLAVIEPKFFSEQRILLLPFNKLSERQVKETLRQYPAQFVVMHECLNRMSTDTGWTPPRDQEHYLEINNVINSDIAAVFLGDIHRCQSLDDGELSWYSGTPTTLDHGHKLPKGLLHHYFRQSSSGVWVKDRSPELIPLDDSRIKVHLQLGKIDRIEDIPLKEISKNRDNYLQLTVTPEAYAVIDKEFPELLHSTNVQWSFPEKETIAPTLDHDKPMNEGANDPEGEEYHRPLIEQWVYENCNNLTKIEQNSCIQRVLKIFEARGDTYHARKEA